MAEKEAAPEPKVKKAEKKGKKVRDGRKHSPVELKKFYSVAGGELKRTKKFCPRCGPGSFLSTHPNRTYCGRCGYTEFLKKAPLKA